MHLFNIFLAALFVASGWTLPTDLVDLVDGGYDPPAERPYGDSVWPRSATQQVTDFLASHFNFIDSTSGTDENANNENCDKFTTFFTSDAVYNFQGLINTGTDAIKQICLVAYMQIPFRKHEILKGYTFGMNDKEIVLTGTVAYGTQSIFEKKRMWTEVFSLVEVDGGLKMKAVHVYADPEPA